MKRTNYTIRKEAREALVRKLAVELKTEPAVGFAYLHGSLLDTEVVHDVDVGVCLRASEVGRSSGRPSPYSICRNSKSPRAVILPFLSL